MTEPNSEQAIQQALQHQMAGRVADAEAIYNGVLQREPSNHQVMFLLGILRTGQGNSAPAAELFEKAIALAPRVADYHYGRGRALMNLGQFDQAANAFLHTLQLMPDRADANHQLGCVLTQLGNPAQAVEYLKKAKALTPGDAKVGVDLANALRHCGRLSEALAVGKRAVEARPREPWGHNILGLVYLDSRDFDAAATHFRRAVALRPNLAEAYVNLAQVSKLLGRPTEAAALLETAIKIRPSYAGAYHNLGVSLLSTGAYPQAISALRQALQLHPAVDTHSSLLYALNFQTNVAPEEILAEHQRWAELHANQFSTRITVHENDPTPDRPLRIGYVSGDLNRHPVSSFLQPILREHDRQQFTAICYSAAAASDEVTERLRDCASEWRNIHDISDADAAAMIAGDRIDILVDLSGHTERNRLLVFARRPAPVQVSYIGYPNTTGMAAMDYRLTDAWVDPPGVADAWQTEKLERLPKGFLCYDPPPDSSDPVRLSQPAGDRAVVFGSFNRIEKLNLDVIAAWAKILNRVRESRLLLKSGVLADPQLCNSIVEAFHSHGIEPRRIELRAGQGDPALHLATYAEVDIALDPFPYNGTATTCEALWMGVPVVSFAGRGHASRVGLSLLAQLGLAELAAASEEQYIDAAVSLAGDFPRLNQLRIELRDRMVHSPLMDAPGHTRDIEAAYRSMWKGWCAGQQA